MHIAAAFGITIFLAVLYALLLPFPDSIIFAFCTGLIAGLVGMRYHN